MRRCNCRMNRHTFIPSNNAFRFVIDIHQHLVSVETPSSKSTKPVLGANSTFSSIAMSYTCVCVCVCLPYLRCVFAPHLLCSWPQFIRNNLCPFESYFLWYQMRKKTQDVFHHLLTVRTHTHTHSCALTHPHTHKINTQTKIGHTRFTHTWRKEEDARDENVWVVTAPAVNHVFATALPAALFITQHSPRSAFRLATRFTAKLSLVSKQRRGEIPYIYCFPFHCVHALCSKKKKEQTLSRREIPSNLPRLERRLSSTIVTTLCFGVPVSLHSAWKKKNPAIVCIVDEGDLGEPAKAKFALRQKWFIKRFGSFEDGIIGVG